MKAEILTILKEADDYVSGQELCEKFGVSRTAVWKAMNQLKKEGYEIESVQNRGYKLISTPDILSENELVSIRKTEWIGKEIHYYDVTDSTNTRAKSLGEGDAPHGTLVVADMQESGKGRRGRSFISPAGTGIFMTLLLKPEVQPQNASMLTLVAAMAVVKGMERSVGITPQIKWPNDIILHGKKVCGILTEMSAQFDYVNYIVVGVGINVHNVKFEEDIENKATSILLETGKRIHRAKLIEAVWEEFEHYYALYLETEDLSKIEKEYNSYLVNYNQKVRVLDPKGEYDGKAMGITKRGELIVDTWEARRLVSAGEVSVRGVHGYV